MSMIVTRESERVNLAHVGARTVKKDAAALLSGKPLFTNDLVPADTLTVKILHSPHAFARIRAIDTSRAMKIPGVVAVYTYRDVPNKRFTLAGQSYPEASPYDRLILDEVVRYVGDEVAIVAAETADAAERALKLIKVDYEVMEPVLDFTQAKGNPIVIHPEDNYHVNGAWINNDRMRNVVASGLSEHGDLEAAFAECDLVIDETYHTLADAQAMMETFRSFAEIDAYGRITVTSSTQVPFHVRRMVANALDIPQSRVRVVKPRIGGGFGAKQSGCNEIFCAFVTYMTGRPSKIIYTREETLASSNSRHEMQMHVRLGAKDDGTIVAIDLYTLSNQGAYGEHGPTTVGLSGHKSLPLYNRARASRFAFDVVYSNTMPAGAYRGYGATQGLFAVESAVNELADRLGMDPCELRLKNLVTPGERLAQYDDNELYSCTAADCLRRAMEMIGWGDKPLRRDLGDRVRGLGVALSMQGSAIAKIDIGSVDLRVEETGFYTLSIGATDMGTGCDTILAQFAAEALRCDTDRIVVHGVDTDVSPFDTGSYASASTYLTGMAVLKASEKLIAELRARAAGFMGVHVDDVLFDGDNLLAFAPGTLEPASGETTPEFSGIYDDVEAIARSYRLAQAAPDAEPVAQMSLVELANKLVAGGDGDCLTAHAAASSPTSPPPFMSGIAEVDVDKATGKVTVVDYVSVVDCGTVVNENLARVQAEGGIGQGIGMALTEDVQYSDTGRMRTRSFMTYKVPTRLDLPDIRVEFAPSYEPTGPFGAKSIGEVVINTPSPAIASAVAHATGHYVRTLPITPEKALFGE
ncbi:xanthine dehydrogenase family protein molybdopterin-binding subunit [Collinsella tanakaei]|uniref:xanthine dehydrogenase family protein molybdopterin-binding subunit n=1 Tax=Collinsella tanakaei TaxID=626935 RepID=UPI0025A34689|nr:molybdopterin cofactor-binding domain-containing protein [Collinsella tanakaei]MDM8299733.1 molybdopterin-dependent oxidoreductase [Collinsella tanakaei]